MIPAKFDYERANSVDEVLTMLAQHGDSAKILAGGHSLIPAMKLRLNQPGVLIDIGRIKELRYIKDGGDHVAIGAGATHDDILQSDHFGGGLEMWTEAAGMIGDPQVRHKGTLGGSIAHADPAADWPAVLLASDATIVVKGSGGQREVASTDFFTGFYMTDLKDGELILEIRVPKPPAGSKSSYQKFMQPASRFAIVGCAAVITTDGSSCSRARVGMTGVADGPYRATDVEDALTGKSLDEGTVESACAGAAEGQSVMSDHFASEHYREHLARVYARRSVMAAT